MKTLGIFTTSRSDYGILSNLLSAIDNDKHIQYKLFVGGSHLTIKQGLTINEIQKKNKITRVFDFLINTNSEYSLNQSLAISTFQLNEIFISEFFDLVCILGDRIELLPIVQTAVIFRKPIIHIHGGEVTEGAIDNQVRHMITKSSHLHFVACTEYYQNVRKMGESDWRIFNTGALGIDGIVKNRKIDKKTLFKQLNLDINQQTIILTYHPVSLEYKIKTINQVENLFNALDNYDFQVVITAPCIEIDSDKIVNYIFSQIKKNKNYHYIKSLGTLKYYNLISHCKFVIGNSSSGIIEAPFFRIPTVNIGDRQKGRIRHSSIIDTDYSTESIQKGIDKAISEDYRKCIKKMTCKFGDGRAAEKMLNIIKDIEINEKLMRKKLEFPE